MDPARLLRPNPFSGDGGGVQPDMAAALALHEPAERVEAIVAALTKGRVFVPVQAHAHPGVDGSGAVAGHEIADPQAEAIDEAGQRRVPAPGGRMAVPLFSCAASLAAFDADARPVPVWGRNIAAQTFAHGGLLALDPRSMNAADAEFYGGRMAAGAIAADIAWVAPWLDPDIESELEGLVGGDGVVHQFRIEAAPNGVTRVFADISSMATREAVAQAIQHVSDGLKANEVLSMRLGIVEFIPVRLA